MSIFPVKRPSDVLIKRLKLYLVKLGDVSHYAVHGFRFVVTLLAFHNVFRINTTLGQVNITYMNDQSEIAGEVISRKVGPFSLSTLITMTISVRPTLTSLLIERIRRLDNSDNNIIPCTREYVC
jgi:hypothetical protein